MFAPAWKMAGDLPMQKQSKMENKLNSLEYFYDKVLDSAEFYNSEYNYIVNALEEAKVMYEKEIDEAKKEGWRKGYEDAIKSYR